MTGRGTWAGPARVRGAVGAKTPIPEETQVSKSHPEQWAVHEVAERPDRPLVAALREFASTRTGPRPAGPGS